MKIDTFQENTQAFLHQYFPSHQLKPAGYVSRMKRIQKDVKATCYTCKKTYASQRGFGSHIDKEKHFPVPVDSRSLVQIVYLFNGSQKEIL